MTSAEIRKSFLDFFKSKEHTIVPSSSLLPDAPNLLFTNAGMNQFVPIFLGQKKPDVSKWAGADPGSDTRAADTQKCIRAGGKHNDLDDVGLDTYHHTFFEMLGNWSFGDYFKKEAIDWAWELVVDIWKFPKERLYATVYQPDKSKNDPSELDQEARDLWSEKFRAAGLDPKIHVVYGNKKDNFWMMGETGPCGPCSEIHIDLTPEGDSRGALVNTGDARCIEIWNLVFIQFNANADGTFSPLPARHVDTGMGFERVTSMIQGTKDFTDFKNAKISNYETDIFRPIFDALEKLSGKKYRSTLPATGSAPAGGIATVPVAAVGVPPTASSPAPGAVARDAQQSDRDGRDPQALTSAEEIQIDIAFRVIADHIRTLSFAIADGIPPGNKERNAVIRRILRRAALFGCSLGFDEPFLYKLVDVLADTMGDFFPEIRAKRDHIQEVINEEENSFNKTLDQGLKLFERITTARPLLARAVASVGPEIQKISKLHHSLPDAVPLPREALERIYQAATQLVIRLTDFAQAFSHPLGKRLMDSVILFVGSYRDLTEKQLSFASQIDFRHKAENHLEEVQKISDEIRSICNEHVFDGWSAFLLHDTYGFPVEETERLARGCGLSLDKPGFKNLMDEQRAKARAAQTKQIVTIDKSTGDVVTEFVGYTETNAVCRIAFAKSSMGRHFVALSKSPFFPAMGGQVGDTGKLRFDHPSIGWEEFKVLDTVKRGSTIYLETDRTLETVPDLKDLDAEVQVDKSRRHAIERHHTVTHLLHWALHEVVSHDAAQKGSYVGPEKLTFDFNSAPLTPQQVADVEKLVNERVLENAGVSWTEVPYAEIKGRKDVMQFFGEKYGDQVRVVQIGGHEKKLDGYSMELCGGTHTRATGEIGLFRIVGENAIAAGVRRIEAVAGLEAYRKASDELHLIKTLAGKINSPVHELEKKLEAMLSHQKELEKSLRAANQRQAAETGKSLAAKAASIGGTRAIIENLGAVDGDFLQTLADSLKGEFKGVVVLGGTANHSVSLIATVSPELTAKFQAGKIIQTIAPIVGGKGGGKPDNARGGGKDIGKLDEALAKARGLLA